MAYDFKTLDHKDKLFNLYPELLNIYEDSVSIYDDDINHKPLSKEELMMFIVYSYHLKSPIVKEPSIHKRRQMALGLIGYDIKTEKDFSEQPELLSFIIGTNQFVNRLAIIFCKFENNYDWMELNRLQELVDDSALLLKEEAAASKNKSASEMQIIKFNMEKQSEPYRQKIRQLAQQIFQNDTNLLSFAASTLLLEKRRRLITPEDIASMPKDELQSAFAE